MRRLLALMLGAAALVQGAVAQTYPDRPIRLVVPFGPGGAADAIARPLAEKLGSALGQQVVVDNRPGALTVIGADLVAKAQPDGYTLYLMPGTHVLTTYLVAKVPHDPIADFTPITLLGQQPYFVFANVDRPYKTFGEMLAYARGKPGDLSIGVSDAVTQIIATAMAKTAGVQLNIVPYKGGGPQNVDLLGNQIATAVGTPNMLQYVQQGKIRPLVATLPQRAPFLPDVPTVSEQVPGSNFDIQTWYAIAGPAKLPQPVVERLHAEISKVMKLPDIQKRMSDLGVVAPADTGPQALRQLMVDYRARMSQRIQDAGIKAE